MIRVFLSTNETRAHVVGPRNPATRKFYRRPMDGCYSTNRKLYDGELICAHEPAIPRYEIPWRATEMLRFSECTRAAVRL